MAHVHPPKIEIFDVPARTNTDPKGFVRPVDEYRTEPFGLYVRRPVQGHPRLAWFESWLLPELGLRVTEWGYHPGHKLDQDYYVDIVDIIREGDVWRTIDLYLDIVTRTGRDSQVLDLDEYVLAVADGLIDSATAERALAASYRALAGLADHQHDLDAWLASVGVELTWHNRTR